MKKLALNIVFLAVVLPANAQLMIGMQEINSTLVNTWIVDDIRDYQASYHFGESEGESSKLIIVDEGIVVAQQRWGEFTGESVDDLYWKRKFHTHHNVRIEGNKFYSDEGNGEFVVYEPEGKQIYGLRFGNEIGYKTSGIDGMFAGEYPQSSTQVIRKQDLSTMSAYQLKIMRNEIFARYGYIFREGGKMDQYFRTQKWYDPQYQNVNSFLTKLEKENIKLIQQFDKR